VLLTFRAADPGSRAGVDQVLFTSLAAKIETVGGFCASGACCSSMPTAVQVPADAHDRLVIQPSSLLLSPGAWKLGRDNSVTLPSTPLVMVATSGA